MNQVREYRAKKKLHVLRAEVAILMHAAFFVAKLNLLTNLYVLFFFIGEWE